MRFYEGIMWFYQEISRVVNCVDRFLKLTFQALTLRLWPIGIIYSVDETKLAHFDIVLQNRRKQNGFVIFLD